MTYHERKCWISPSEIGTQRKCRRCGEAYKIGTGFVGMDSVTRKTLYYCSMDCAESATKTRKAKEGRK